MKTEPAQPVERPKPLALEWRGFYAQARVLAEKARRYQEEQAQSEPAAHMKKAA